LFNFDIVEEDEAANPDDASKFPILNQIKLEINKKINEKEILDFIAYNRYLESELLYIFSERKIKLDFKYSIERDSFYNKFNQLSRSIDEYCEESERLKANEGNNFFKDEMMKRKNKVRHSIFLDMHNFYSQINRFSSDLIEDISNQNILCLNGQDELDFSEYEKTTILRGLTVEQGLKEIFKFTNEVITYLNIPSF
jgi:hypothetical protein